jgi:hypothetical protein
MNKQLTILLSLTFLFLFSSSVYSEEIEVKREYWGNGKLKSETHYKDGMKEGLRIKWYENGKKKSEGNFKNGLQHGLWIWWNKNGTKKISKKAVLKNLAFKKEVNSYETEAIASEMKNDLKVSFEIYIDHYFSISEEGSLEFKLEFKTISVDLNDDGIDEVIVVTIGPGLCGSGGCGYSILQKFEDNWKQIGSFFGAPIVGHGFKLSNIKENGYFTIFSKNKYSGYSELNLP